MGIFSFLFGGKKNARFHYGKFTRMKAAQEAAEKRKLKR